MGLLDELLSGPAGRSMGGGRMQPQQPMQGGGGGGMSQVLIALMPVSGCWPIVARRAERRRR